MEVLAPSPSHVRLHISIKDKETRRYTEIVRGSSKGYETVEVDGLVFRRKRKQENLPLQDVEEKKQKVLLPENSSGNHGSSLQEALAGADIPQEVFSEGLPAAHEDPQEQEPRAEADVIQKAEEESPAADPELNMAATVQTLLEGLPEEASEGQKLLAVCDGIHEALPEHKCRGLTAALKARIAEALQEGSLMCYKPPEPDCVLEKAEQAKKEKMNLLQNQVTSLQREKLEWQAVLKEGQVMAETDIQLSHEDNSQEERPAQSAQVLQSLQQQSHTALSFQLQVEGLAAMLSKVEQLLNRAENQCRVMQVEYHKEKFLKFPHIDSPARLIREIVRERQI